MTKAEKNRKNGKLGGRPKGSTNKFKIDDFIDDAQFKRIMQKAAAMAELGNERMITFIGDHKMGKAVQPTDMNIVGDMYIYFDEEFKKKK